MPSSSLTAALCLRYMLIATAIATKAGCPCLLAKVATLAVATANQGFAYFIFAIDQQLPIGLAAVADVA
jgi:hypothetical protein